MFEAIVIEKDEAGYRAGPRQVDEAMLSPGDVVVRVEASTINYKDGLAVTGKAPVVRNFPMIPGIDFAGTVLASASPLWAEGDKVLLNGWGVGETHTGGLAERARVRPEWLLKLPDAFTAAQAMAIGTAGYTAMLAVMAIEAHGTVPGSGDVLVTGAAGGVGSIAIALLARRGFRVIASTGRQQEAGYLAGLGAAEVIDRATLSAPGKPLGRERWAAAVDAVGSHTLANACASTRYGGIVAACGLAQGMDLPASVAPFILRGVTLTGIESVNCPAPRRQEAWDRLSRELPADLLERMTLRIGLGDVVGAAADILAGKVRGRLVVAMEGVA